VGPRIPLVIPLSTIRNVVVEQRRWWRWRKLRIRADARDYNGAVFITFGAVQPLVHALTAHGVSVAGESGDGHRTT
jgi:hypothetical protein